MRESKRLPTFAVYKNNDMQTELKFIYEAVSNSTSDHLRSVRVGSGDHARIIFAIGSKKYYVLKDTNRRFFFKKRYTYKSNLPMHLISAITNKNFSI